MKAIKHILVVMQPMSDHQPALIQAIKIAKETSATIELFLAAYHKDIVSPWGFDKKQTAALQQEYLASKLRWLETYLPSVVEQGLTIKLDVVWHKNITKAVCEKLEQSNIDLVVKSTHQSSRLNKILFNPSDWQLLQHCKAPLLLTRSLTKEPYNIIAAAVDPSQTHNKPQALDKTILDMTIGLVALFESEIHVCHCYQPLGAELWQGMNVVGGDHGMSSMDFESYHQNIKQHHERLFNELVADYGFAEGTTQLRVGAADYELAKLVEETQTELLVMGMGNQSSFVGNTVEKILDNVNCDILSVRVDEQSN